MKYPANKFQNSVKKATKRELSNEVATREATTFLSMLNWLPNPDPVLKKMGGRIETYRDLMGDWEVFAAEELIENGLDGLDWTLEPNDADERGIEFIQALLDSYWDVPSIMSECVDARNFGYQPFEFLWDKVDGYWTIIDIVGKPPEWFNFNRENELQLKTIKKPLGMPVNWWQFALARNRSTYRNPYGEAVLSRVFWPVTFKKGGIRFYTKFVEKHGTPWVVGKEPRGSQNTNELLDRLEKMVQDAVAVIPDDSSVDLLGSGGEKSASSNVHTQYIHYCDAAINKVILSNELSMGVSKDGGQETRGDSRTQAGVSQQIINKTGSRAQKIINDAIKRIWSYNFEGSPPIFKIYEPKSVQKDLAERDKTLSETGVKFKKEYYMSRYDLGEDEFEIQEDDNSEPLPGPGMSHQEQGKSRIRDRYNSKPGSLPDDTPTGGYQGEGRLPVERRERRELPIGLDKGSDKTRFREEGAKNQEVIDQAVELAGGEDAVVESQRTMEAMLQPILDLIENAGSYDDVLEGLYDLYPDMDSEELQQRLMSARFLADTWGRLTAQEEINEDSEEEE